MSKVLVLRTCNSDFTSFGGFQWPATGHVSAPDWVPSRECSNGLHGFLWGEGNGSFANCDDNAIWQVVEVDSSDIVYLAGKIKFREGNVIFSGSRQEAADIIIRNAPIAVKCIGATVVVGDHEKAEVGDYGYAVAGYCGYAVAGYCGNATAGNYGSAEAGYCGNAIAGDYGNAIAGHHGKAVAGNNSTGTAGEYGTVEIGNFGNATAEDYGNATVGYAGNATAGDWGTAEAGYYGNATAGDYGTAVAGYGGTVAAGESGTIKIGNVLGKIGENGLLPNTCYCLDENGNFIEEWDS